MKTGSNLLKLIAGAFFAFMFGNVAHAAISAIPATGASVVIFAFMFIPKGSAGLAYAGIDLTDIPASMKKFVACNKGEFLTLLGLEARPDYFNIITGAFGEYPITSLVAKSLLQPGGKDAFNPKDAVKFSPRIGYVRHAKIDVLLLHTEIMALYNTYLSDCKIGKVDPFEVPFEEEIMNAIVSSGKFDARDALFNGVYNAAGTAAVDVVDGLRTIVAGEITSGKIPAANVYAGAAITAANAMDQIKAIAALVNNNKRYGKAEMIALMSPQIEAYYNEDYASTRGATPYNNKYGQTMIEGSNITIQTEPMLAGSNRVIITPKDNLYYLVNDENALSDIKVQEFDRSLKILIDFFFGMQIGMTELVWTNNHTGIV